MGTLKDLAKASKGGVDPDGEGDTRIAGDVLWSDPAAAEDVTGIVENENRGIGTMFGPDATEDFLRTNGSSLEGFVRTRDRTRARTGRTCRTWTEDSASITTSRGSEAVHGVQRAGLPAVHRGGRAAARNKATFVVLTAEGEWATPAPVAFTAAKPRPNSQPYYDITVGGSDEEGPDGDLRVKRADAEEKDGAEDEEDGKENARCGETRQMTAGGGGGSNRVRVVRAVEPPTGVHAG